MTKYKTIRITDTHLRDLQNMVSDQEKRSDKLISEGRGAEACDANEFAEAVTDLIESAQ